MVRNGQARESQAQKDALFPVELGEHLLAALLFEPLYHLIVNIYIVNRGVGDYRAQHLNSYDNHFRHIDYWALLDFQLNLKKKNMARWSLTVELWGTKHLSNQECLKGKQFSDLLTKLLYRIMLLF